MNKHVPWIARTIFVSVKKNDPEKTFRALETILRDEGHHQNWRRNRYFEKGFMKRRRLAFEQCKDIYNQEMQRKINFVLKAKHENPWRID